MFSTSILEVAIGLIFVFSLLAILVTQINSFVVNVLNLRAKQLKEGLQNLITDPDMQAKILAHPLINMVEATASPFESLTKSEADNITSAKATNVTWIPSATFVEALTSILTADSDFSLYRQLQRASEDMTNDNEKSQIRELIRQLQTDFSEETIRQLRIAIEKVGNEDKREALRSGLEHTENALEKLRFKNSELIPLLEGIRKIENKSFQTAVETIISSAQKADEAREKLEAWFNDSMSRTSAVFSRRLQMISVLVALVLVLLLNVDTLYVARSLWEDPQLRQSVAVAAGAFDQTTAATGTTAPAGGTTTEDPSLSESIAVLEGNTDDIAATVQSLLELQLPIGWEFTAITNEMVMTSQRLGIPDPRQNTRNLWNLVPGNNANWFGLLIQKIAGLVVTTIAAAQGAPFWFDLLNKLTRR